MAKIKTIAILILFLFACEKDDPNPLGDIAKQQWFKDLQVPCEKEDVCKTGIMQGMYLGTTVVYFTYLGGGYCDVSFYVKLYNEQGDVVKIYDESNPSEFFDEVSSYETVWYCSCGYNLLNGVCITL